MPYLKSILIGSNGTERGRKTEKTESFEDDFEVSFIQRLCWHL